MYYKYLTLLDTFPQLCYSTNRYSQGSNPMPVTNAYCIPTKYRITLELDVLDDFNPRQINWEKMFELQDNESVECYIEELD
jgi:hypothetical protein